MKITETGRIIAEKELESIGGTPRVFRYRDDGGKNHIDILSSADRPRRGVISYATIGLSEYDAGLFCGGKTLRVEFLGACGAEEERFADVLASAAFEAMRSGKCSYGDVVRNVVAERRADSEMKHAYLTSPFLWEGFETLEFSDAFVAWLLIVPISDKERDYAVENGWEALEDAFEKRNIDVFDLKRKSIF